MIGRIFVKIPKKKKILNTIQKIFAWKFLTVTEKSSKKRNDFTQLWRHWPRLLKVKAMFVCGNLRSPTVWVC